MAREERNYSHRSLADKLGIKRGQRIYTRGPFDEAFLQMCHPEPPMCHPEPPMCHPERVEGRASGKHDLIFVYVNAPSDLRAIASLAKHLTPVGGLWVMHPKGKGASPNDATVRATGLAAGLVDNKISAFSDTHTATRYVIPKVRR